MPELTIMLDTESEYDNVPPVIRFPMAKCKRCGNEWAIRTPNPKQCPSCKSTVWNKPRVTDSRPKAQVAS